MENLDIFIDFIENEYYVHTIGCPTYTYSLLKQPPCYAIKPPLRRETPIHFLGHFFYKNTLKEKSPFFEAIFLQNHRNSSSHF